MELHTTNALSFIAMLFCGALLAALLRLNSATYARGTVNAWKNRGLVEPDVDGPRRLDLVHLFSLPTRGQAVGAFVGAWVAGSIGYFLFQVPVWGYQLGAFIAAVLTGQLLGYVLTHRRASAWGEAPDVVTYLSPDAVRARRLAWPLLGATAVVGAGVLFANVAKGSLILLAALWAALILLGLRWLTAYAVRRATLFDAPDSPYLAWRWATRADLANLASNITCLAVAAFLAQGAIGGHSAEPQWWSTALAALPAVALAILALIALVRSSVHFKDQVLLKPW